MIANTPGFGSGDVASWSKFAVRDELSKISPISIKSYPAITVLSPGSGYADMLS
jgi:hypothetical protein